MVERLQHRLHLHNLINAQHRKVLRLNNLKQLGASRSLHNLKQSVSNASSIVSNVSRVVSSASRVGSNASRAVLNASLVFNLKHDFKQSIDAPACCAYNCLCLHQKKIRIIRSASAAL